MHSNLGSLVTYVNEIEAALALFDHAGKLMTANVDARRPDISRWQFIAARDGALQLYHFGQTLTSIDGLLSRGLSIAKHAKTDKLRDARAEFDQHFPHWWEIRQGAAHLADFSKTPDRLDQNAAPVSQIPFITIPGADPSLPIYAANNLHGRVYSCTVGKRFVSYSLSKETVSKLMEVTEITFAAFRPVSRYTFDLAFPAASIESQQLFGD